MKLKNITALYRASPEFHNLSFNTIRIYEQAFGYLKEWMDKDGDWFTRPKIIDIRDKLAKNGVHQCRMGIWVLNNIMSFGYDRGLCANNHAARVKGLPKTKPIARWTDEECEKFLKAAPDYLRLAFYLALYTGQRRSDLIRMKWSQYDGKVITLLQQKTGRLLHIPVHPELKRELDAAKKRQDKYFAEKRKMPHGCILNSARYEMWSLDYFTNSFRLLLKELGIKGRSVHGLRKTTAAKLAELGCSPHLIASITGHKSLTEIMNYTSEADQKRMAMEAMDTWVSSQQTP